MKKTALLLQPLLENAIFHGIEPEIKGGTIWVEGKFKHHQLNISIKNSNSQNVVHRQGNKMALDNIRERLSVFYQGNASIECIEEKGMYYTQLIIPYRTKSELQ